MPYFYNRLSHDIELKKKLRCIWSQILSIDESCASLIQLYTAYTGDIPVFYRLIRLNLASIVGTVTSWEGDG